MEPVLKIGLFIERSRAFGRELCEGIISHAQDRHWEIRYLAPDDLHKRKLIEFDGFIARVTTRPIARAFAASKRPVVDVFYNLPDCGFAIVKEKHETIGRLAAEHFLDRRFSHFAYCPYGGGKTSIYCRNAFVQRLRHAEFCCDIFPNSTEIAYATGNQTVIGDRIARPSDARELTRWLKRLPKPTAVFCPDDLRAWQLLEICRDNGFSVPNDVAILGLDNDILICGGTQPMLSSIDPNTREIGRVAAQTLDDMMSGDRQTHRPIIRQVEPIGVIARGSTETYPLDPPWLSDALIYIQRNTRRGLSASDVFSFVGLSHTIVTRTFRKALGLTVQQAIASARLEESKRLLCGSELPIAQIAREAGFASLSYFLQSFTKAIGISPGQWRQRQKTESPSVSMSKA